MSGGTTTTQNNIPAPSQQELDLISKQSELADQQLQAIKAQAPFNQQLLDAARPLIGQQADILRQQGDITSQQLAQLSSPEALKQQQEQQQLTDLQLQSALKNQPIQDQLLQLQLDTLKRGGAATDEQKSLIGQATDAAINSGTSDINASRDDALQQLKLNLAPSLGLRPGDTPILDRGNLVGKEAVRQTGQLTTNLRGAQAQAELNYPLAQQQLQSGINQGQQGLITATGQFQNQLAQAASANRLALFGGAGGFTGQAGNLGLGLATGTPGASALSSAVGALNDRSLASRSSTTTSNPGIFSTLLGSGGLGGILGGFGGGLSGLKAIRAF